MRILCVCGARPNFVKLAAVVRAAEGSSDLSLEVVHTGQHYDPALSRVFFDQLGLPTPSHHLGIGSGSHTGQTAAIMTAFEPILGVTNPDLVIVVGDVNSTLACALVAAKQRIPLAHVEAGLRSFDRSMPEELNRIATDALSDLLFVTEPSGRVNLSREGVPESNVFFVGNTMIDTLLAHRDVSADSDVLRRLGLEPRRFALTTLHRAGTVDRPEILGPILELLADVSRHIPVIFPVHPRTRQRLEERDHRETLQGSGVHLLPPLAYLDFLRLMDTSCFVLTDSGGVQEETTALGVPCLTARENTERPVTLEQGTNVLVGLDPSRIREAIERVLAPPEPLRTRVPEMWDGAAGKRIVDVIQDLGPAGLRDLQHRRSGTSTRP